MARSFQPETPEDAMDQSSPRFAHVSHTLTIEVQIDLLTRTVFQVLIDHTAPLRACGQAEDDDPFPSLKEDDERFALSAAMPALARVELGPRGNGEGRCPVCGTEKA
jgi:hypothetical protein